MKYVCIFIFSLMMASCHAQENKMTTESKEVKTASSNDFKSRLEVVGVNDQKYRVNKVADWEKLQNELDRLNRIEIDELYQSYGYPKRETEGDEGIMYFLLVIHHSSDCAWNKKWIKVILDDHKPSGKHINLVKYMFQRTFGDASGICKITDEEKKDILKSYDPGLLQEFDIYDLVASK